MTMSHAVWISSIVMSLFVASTTGAIPYDTECGKTIGCFHNCQPTCSYLLTWSPGTSTVDFVLKQETSNSNAWFGIGLSSDTSMGSDSVTMCFYQGGTVTVKQTYNPGYSNNFLSPDTQGLSATSGSYNNGVLTCQFTRDKAASTNFFELTSTWYLLFAEGQFSAPDNPQKHSSSPIISSVKVDFLKTVDVTGSPAEDKTSLYNAHGSMMMFAWISTSTIGILIAMYFKLVWSETKIGGLHIWFQIHRACMTLTVILTVIAFIIIFVAKEGEYSEIVGDGIKKYHPVFGIITFVLAVINPFMALLRPKPDHEKRWIFNLCHWFVGIGANTFGIVAIFGGVYIQTDNGLFPDYAVYLLYAFVAWYFVVSVLLQILSRTRRNQGNGSSMEMTPVGGSSQTAQESKQNPTYVVMQVLLGIHILFVIAITITLIALLVSEEDE